jgi:hypothetical protein
MENLLMAASGTFVAGLLIGFDIAKRIAHESFMKELRKLSTHSDAVILETIRGKR